MPGHPRGRLGHASTLRESASGVGTRSPQARAGRPFWARTEADSFADMIQGGPTHAPAENVRRAPFGVLASAPVPAGSQEE